jgi:hypothetical protein
MMPFSIFIIQNFLFSSMMPFSCRVLFAVASAMLLLSLNQKAAVIVVCDDDAC